MLKRISQSQQSTSPVVQQIHISPTPQTTAYTTPKPTIAYSTKTPTKTSQQPTPIVSTSAPAKVSSTNRSSSVKSSNLFSIPHLSSSSQVSILKPSTPPFSVLVSSPSRSSSPTPTPSANAPYYAAASRTPQLARKQAQPTSAVTESASSKGSSRIQLSSDRSTATRNITPATSSTANAIAAGLTKLTPEKLLQICTDLLSISCVNNGKSQPNRSNRFEHFNFQLKNT